MISPTRRLLAPCLSFALACQAAEPAPASCGLVVEDVRFLDSDGAETAAGATHPIPSIRLTFNRDIRRSTITEANVVLTEATGAGIAVHGNSANFPNSATITPREALRVSTAHTLTLGSGIQGADGCALTRHEVPFVVRDEPLPPATYTLQTLSIPGGVVSPTSLAFGPDARLYVGQHDGAIKVLRLTAEKTVYDVLYVSAVQGRSLLGIAVAGTEEAPELWASHSEANWSGAPDPSLGAHSGIVSRLTGDAFDVREDVVTGLPRSAELHQNNGIAFQPGTTRLFIAVGGTTNYGAPSSKLGERKETLLSASILVVDVALVDAPLDVRPVSEGGAYPLTPEDYLLDKHGLTPEVPLRVYATGLRNPYDLVWTRASEPRLFATDNGGNQGWGTTAGPEHGCTGQVATDPGNHPDEVNLIEAGAYYGHPNPSRGQCAFNDAGHVPAVVETGLNLSTDGIAEYDAPSLPGTEVERGDLLYVNYSSSDALVRWRPSTGESRVLVQPLENPLDVTVQADGTIFVAEFGTTPGTAQLGESRVSFLVAR